MTPSKIRKSTAKALTIRPTQSVVFEPELVLIPTLACDGFTSGRALHQP